LFPHFSLSPGFAALAWVEELSHWAPSVPAVMSYLVAVEALKVLAVADAHNGMLFGAALIMFV